LHAQTILATIRNKFSPTCSTHNFLYPKPNRMRHGIASKSCSPATVALEKALKLAATPVINKKRPMISFKQQSRSFLGSFDLSSLVEASQPVEDLIAFPSIEWSNDINSEDDDAEVMAPAAATAKQRCRGLVRSNNRMESLSSLC
jgi:hypothetical protein